MSVGRVPILLIRADFKTGWMCASITRQSLSNPFCGDAASGKSEASFRSVRDDVGAMVAIGNPSQSFLLERTMQVLPFSWNFRSSSLVAGITTALSSTMQTSPADSLRPDAPITFSASFQSMDDYLPAFSRRGRQSSRISTWCSARSFASPLTDVSTWLAKSRKCSSLFWGGDFGAVAIGRRLFSDMTVYLACQARKRIRDCMQSFADNFNSLRAT